MLFLCALVEQRLLGMHEGSMQQIRHLKKLDYLEQNWSEGMPSMNSFYQAGLRGYAKALFAARQFERVLDGALGELLAKRKEDLAEAFGVQQLDGGNPLAQSPNLDQLLRTPLNKWWAWSVRKFWIASERGCFLYIGFLIDEGQPCASIALFPSGAAMRRELYAALETFDPGFAYLNNQANEIVMRKHLSIDGSLEDFIKTQEELIDKFIGFLQLHAPRGLSAFASGSL